MIRACYIEKSQSISALAACCFTASDSSNYTGMLMTKKQDVLTCIFPNATKHYIIQFHTVLSVPATSEQKERKEGQIEKIREKKSLLLSF